MENKSAIEDCLEQVNKKRCFVYLPKIKLKDLADNTTYKITSLKQILTRKYGAKLVAEINNEFTIFLPDRANILKNTKVLETLQKCVEDETLHLNWIGGEYFKSEFNIL